MPHRHHSAFFAFQGPSGGLGPSDLVREEGDELVHLEGSQQIFGSCFFLFGWGGDMKRTFGNFGDATLI